MGYAKANEAKILMKKSIISRSEVHPSRPSTARKEWGYSYAETGDQYVSES
jgi:hypothetical protein